MKKYNKFFISMVSIFVMFGCSRNLPQDKNTKAIPNEAVASAKEAPKQEVQKGITVNKIAFEDVTESKIPVNLENSIKVLKANRGYIYTEENGEYYIAIFSGKRNTGGYSIKVLSVEDNEGKTNILIEEKSPQESDMVIQAITYPYVVIKAKGITPNINIKNLKGEAFERVIKEEEMY
jgi:hypothetical protein